MDQHLGRKSSGREAIGCRREDKSTVNKLRRCILGSRTHWPWRWRHY